MPGSTLRVDMLGLAAILAQIRLVGRDSKGAAFYAGSSLLGLSYFIKQTNMALIAGTIIVWLLWDRRRGSRCSSSPLPLSGSAFSY